MDLKEMLKLSNTVNSQKWESYWKTVFKTGVKQCSCCKKELLIENFSIKKNGLLVSQCKSCENIRGKEKLKLKTSTVEGKFELLLYGVKRRCKVKNIEFSIDLAYLLDLYKKQNGKCYYTNKVMNIIPNGIKSRSKLKDFYGLSIDRIDSLKGYTKDNIVLCCLGINIMKQDLPLSVFLDLCKNINFNLNEKM